MEHTDKDGNGVRTITLMLAPSSSMGSWVWKSILGGRDTFRNLLKNWSRSGCLELLVDSLHTWI